MIFLGFRLTTITKSCIPDPNAETQLNCMKFRFHWSGCMVFMDFRFRQFVGNSAPELPWSICPWPGSLPIFSALPWKSRNNIASHSAKSFVKNKWVFPKIGIPQNGWWKQWKPLFFKWMIWGEQNPLFLGNTHHEALGLKILLGVNEVFQLRDAEIWNGQRKTARMSIQWCNCVEPLTMRTGDFARPWTSDGSWENMSLQGRDRFFYKRTGHFCTDA